MADYQARINLLVTGQNRLRDVQAQLQSIEQTVTDLERRQRVAGAAATRSRTLARAIGGTDQPRGAGGRFVSDPNREQRFAILAAERRLGVENRLNRILTSRARNEAAGLDARITQQNNLNRRIENQVTLEARLNAAVDLYQTNVRKFQRGGGGAAAVSLREQAQNIESAFAAFESGGSRNLQLIRSLGTELGRVVQAQNELNRSSSLGSKGFEAGRRIQERLTTVGARGVTDPEAIRRVRSMATEAIAASRTGDQQAYNEAIRRATAATARLERESLETANALNNQQRELTRIVRAEAAASEAARSRLAAEAQRRQERNAFLAGAPVSQFPIGPNPRSTRRRFDGDTSVERAEGALRAKELQAQRQLNARFFAEEKAQVLELDRIRALSAQKQTQRIQNIGKAVQGSLSSAAIGGAFPLLFGQSPQAALGGAIGGLLGGTAGGFAGSLLGTALGEIEAAKAKTKELALELGLSSTQAKELSKAFELAGRNSDQLEAAITNIQGLGLSTNETTSAIKIAVELSKEYGGSVEKIAQAFADTLESGKVSVSTLNKFTAQGIPIQEELANKLGVSRTKLLEMAKDGQVSVQQVTDALVTMGQKAESTADKAKTGFDRFTSAVQGIAVAIASAAGAILKNLVPALDTVLTRLSGIIQRATAALSLIADAQVGEASTAIFKSGMSRGTGFANKGDIDNIKNGLKSLQPGLATTREQLDRIDLVATRAAAELSKFGGALGEYSVGTAQVELSRVQNDLARRRQQLGAPAPSARIGGINAPANLPPSGDGGGRKAAAPPEDRTQQLIDEFNAVVAIGKAEDKIRDLLFDGREVLAAKEELTKKIADIERDRSNALRGANYESEKAVINKIAEARIVDATFETEDKLRAIKQERFEKELDMQDAVRSSVQMFTDMRKERELELQYTKTYGRLVSEGLLPAEAERIANFEKVVNGKLQELDLEIAITQNKILQGQADGLAIQDLQKKLGLLQKQKEAIAGAAAGGPGQGPTDRSRLTAEITATQGQLNTLVDPINQIIAGADAISSAFANAFKGVISGSMSASEALSSFFQSVADNFLDMASQIIAKWIEMTILNTILGLFPGGGGGSLGFGGASDPLGAGGAFWNAKGNAFGPSGIIPFAKGGVVSDPTVFPFANGGTMSTGIMGEAGPEAIMPLSRGSDGKLGVQADLSGAMSRYRRPPGTTFSADGTTDEAGNTVAPVNGPIDVRYSVERINSVDYVTADQFQQGMQQAAAQGAQRGEQMVLRKLQQSPSTRRRIGMS